MRAGKDSLAGERGPSLAGPVDVGVVANGEEEVQVFREQEVVVSEVEAEERKGFGE